MNVIVPATGATTGVPSAARTSWPWWVWPLRGAPKRVAVAVRPGDREDAAGRSGTGAGAGAGARTVSVARPDVWARRARTATRSRARGAGRDSARARATSRGQWRHALADRDPAEVDARDGPVSVSGRTTMRARTVRLPPRRCAGELAARETPAPAHRECDAHGSRGARVRERRAELGAAGSAEGRGAAPALAGGGRGAGGETPAVRGRPAHESESSTAGGGNDALPESAIRRA